MFKLLENVGIFSVARRSGSSRLLSVSAAFVAASAAMISSASALAASADYPDKPIKIVLGFAAGGGTDAVTRILARKMTDLLHQSVIVENKPGANGNLAADAVARAPADGYTLLYNTSSIASSPALYKSLTYSVMKDFTPVARTVELPQILIVPEKSPFKTLREFVDYAKANPKKLNYATAGIGNVTHIATLSFGRDVGIESTHVPYKGEAPAISDLMAGQVDYYWATSAGAIPAIKSGRVRALAVATKERLETLPDVPTLEQALGLKLYLSSWSGVMAPAGTPEAVIVKLNKAINQVLKDKDVGEFFAGQSAIATPSTPGEYRKFLEDEIAKQAVLIRAANVTAE